MLVWQQQATKHHMLSYQPRNCFPAIFSIKSSPMMCENIPTEWKNWLNLPGDVFHVSFKDFSIIRQGFDCVLYDMRRISNPIQWRRKMELVIEWQTDIFLVDLHKIIKIWQEKGCFFQLGTSNKNIQKKSFFCLTQSAQILWRQALLLMHIWGLFLFIYFLLIW